MQRADSTRNSRLPRYRPFMSLAQPITCLESWVPNGVAPLRSDNFRAILIRAGSGRLLRHDGTIDVTAGQLVVLASGETSGGIAATPIEMAEIHVHPAFLVDLLRWSMPYDPRDRRATFRILMNRVLAAEPLHLSESEVEELEDGFHQLAGLTAADAPAGERAVRGADLIWKIGTLYSAGAGERPAEFCPGRLLGLRAEVQHVMDLMQSNFQQPLTVAELARGVALSPSALRRAFARVTGMSPREYLHRVRLAHFEALLARTSVSIADATHQVGWTSTAHARQVFVRNHGVTPREFREEMQAQLRLPKDASDGSSHSSM